MLRARNPRRSGARPAWNRPLFVFSLRRTCIGAPSTAMRPIATFSAPHATAPVLNISFSGAKLPGAPKFQFRSISSRGRCGVDPPQTTHRTRCRTRDAGSRAGRGANWTVVLLIPSRKSGRVWAGKLVETWPTLSRSVDAPGTNATDSPPRFLVLDTHLLHHHPRTAVYVGCVTAWSTLGCLLINDVAARAARPGTVGMSAAAKL